LVHATLAARRPLEMLDCVRDVDVGALQPRFVERFIEQCAGRSDKRPALQVFRIAWLFADQHDRRATRPFAADGLCGVAP
jgi:hypothetical protein